MRQNETAGRGPEDAPIVTPFCGNQNGHDFNRQLMETVAGELGAYGLEIGVDVQTPDGHEATILAFHLDDCSLQVLVRFKRSQDTAYYSAATLAPIERQVDLPESELDVAKEPKAGTVAGKPSIEFVVPKTERGALELRTDERLRAGVSFGVDWVGADPRFVIHEGGLEEFSTQSYDRLQEVLQGYVAEST